MTNERELTSDELDAVSGGADDQYKESIHIDSWSWTGWTGTGGGGGGGQSTGSGAGRPTVNPF